MRDWISRLREVKIEVLLPGEAIPPLRAALAELGALTVGRYDCVISYHPTQGSWRPLPGSRPFAGEEGKLCEGSEYKLEFRCPCPLVKEAVACIRRLHPYEEPVFSILPLLNSFFEEEGPGAAL